MSAAVKAWVATQKADGGLFKDNGYYEGAQFLNESGDGSVRGEIRALTNKATQESGSPDKTPLWHRGYRNAVEYWQNRYSYYIDIKGWSPTQARDEALKDVRSMFTVDVNGQASPLSKTGQPVKDSIFFKEPETPSDGDTKAIKFGNNYIAKGFKETGNSKFLQDEVIPDSHKHIPAAIAYFEGKGTIPHYYKMLAKNFPGVSADKLVRWQLLAYGIKQPELLNIYNAPPVEIALDMKTHNNLRRQLGFKPTTCAEMQCKATIHDQGIDRDESGSAEDTEGDESKDYSGGIIPGDTEGNIQVPKDAVSREYQTREIQPIIPEGWTIVQDGNAVKDNLGSIHSIDSPKFWPENPQPGDTRVVNGVVQTWTPGKPNIKATPTSNLDKLKEDLAKRPWQQKVFEFITGAGAEKREEIYRQETGLDPTHGWFNKSNYSTLSKEAKDPNYTISAEPTGSWVGPDNTTTETAIDASGKEKTYNTKLGPGRRNEEYLLEQLGYDPDKYYIIQEDFYWEGPLGIKITFPGKPGLLRIYPRNKVNNLQSALNQPNSPYLADNLRDYSAKLFAEHVALEIPTNV